MAGKELKKLSRQELLELLVEQGKQLEAARVESLRSQNDAMQAGSDLAAALMDLEQAEDELQKARKDHALVQEKLSETQSQLAEAQSQLSESTSELDATREELALAVDEIASMRLGRSSTKLDASISERLTRLEIQMDDLATSLSDASAKGVFTAPRAEQTGGSTSTYSTPSSATSRIDQMKDVRDSILKKVLAAKKSPRGW